MTKISLTHVTFVNPSFTIHQELFPSGSGTCDNPYFSSRVSRSRIRIWDVRATWGCSFAWTYCDPERWSRPLLQPSLAPLRHHPLSLSLSLGRNAGSFVKRLGKLFLCWFWRSSLLVKDKRLTLRSSQHLSFPATPGASPNMDAAKTSCSVWPWWRPREKSCTTQKLLC